jgi:hypothetical protein
MNKSTFIMESTSFTDLVCNNILSYQKSIGRANEGLIIQELRGWSGQKHELHRLQQTTIKGEEAALSKTTLSSQKTTFSQTETPSQKTRRRKRSIFCHTKTFFAKLHENS